ncbi:MAG: hypothetical protein BGO55_23300 [Sphingobacteriales bacterium 50-39]|nr:MAG: hypothetical protein BGO55_23300 [Sphingobacteriales bacterium 50-39]
MSVGRKLKIHENISAIVDLKRAKKRISSYHKSNRVKRRLGTRRSVSKQLRRSPLEGMPEIRQIQKGMCQVFIQHSGARDLVVTCWGE